MTQMFFSLVIVYYLISFGFNSLLVTGHGGALFFAPKRPPGECAANGGGKPEPGFRPIVRKNNKKKGNER